MSSIAIPLTVHRSRIERNDNIADAITGYLTLLSSTPRYLTAVDPEFGFMFNNLKFENVNEKEGVVYDKKLSGSSKNLNTFAAELQQTIIRYEPRLNDVKVNMTYIQCMNIAFLVYFFVTSARPVIASWYCLFISENTSVRRISFAYSCRYITRLIYAIRRLCGAMSLFRA